MQCTSSSLSPHHSMENRTTSRVLASPKSSHSASSKESPSNTSATASIAFTSKARHRSHWPAQRLGQWGRQARALSVVAELSPEEAHTNTSLHGRWVHSGSNFRRESGCAASHRHSKERHPANVHAQQVLIARRFFQQTVHLACNVQWGAIWCQGPAQVAG